ncbi:MAG TPA: hypothetical protein VFW98_12835 [Gemmatimonadaceae bacterium]|nr:hypothetical protein [Gemmatimonadaceae bacterium]
MRPWPRRITHRPHELQRCGLAVQEIDGPRLRAEAGDALLHDHAGHLRGGERTGEGGSHALQPLDAMVGAFERFGLRR